MDRRKLFTIAAVLALIAISLAIALDLNDGSLDYRDSEVRYIPTGSMDAGKDNGTYTIVDSDGHTVAIAATFDKTSRTYSYDYKGSSGELTESEIKDGGYKVLGNWEDMPIHTIPRYSLVTIKHLSYDECADIQVGDVIAWETAGNVIIVHRCVENDVDNQKIITRGDNTDMSDTPIPYASIHGEVTGVSHTMGMLTKLVKTNAVLIIAMIACVIVMILSILEIMRYFMNQRTE